MKNQGKLTTLNPIKNEGRDDVCKDDTKLGRTNGLNIWDISELSQQSFQC